jgi:DNA gyrase subunit B
VPFQQAVGEALANYLEEHPKEAKLIVDKVVLAATARMPLVKARESVQRKSRCRVVDCRANWPTVLTRTRRNASSSSSRVTPPAVLPNRVVTVTTQAILPLRGKILNVEKVMWHKALESEESFEHLYRHLV